jgi:hypothetical protein
MSAEAVREFDAFYRDTLLRVVVSRLSTDRWRRRRMLRTRGAAAAQASTTPAPSVVGSRDGARATATVLDPATGATRWEMPYRVGDDLVYYDDLLVRQE